MDYFCLKCMTTHKITNDAIVFRTAFYQVKTSKMNVGFCSSDKHAVRLISLRQTSIIRHSKRFFRLSKRLHVRQSIMRAPKSFIF
ncbi:hypothetical protein SD71_15255 [Cohnella kolymensis]|uniref:DUF3973 domain-containing protein n=1 Tax=Cohnella kolymensis TaxID=1590652 RepID=A0ABR5A1T2_9BACL|nr:hypothetical protein SD71_15255 [Cohnella kolymensis]